jgi:hypothetical protein
LRIKPIITIGITLTVALSLVVALSLFRPAQKVSAACSPATTYGADALTINAPSATTYRVWTRIMAPDATNNTLDLEVDGGNCITVGGGSISANTWTWVDYQNGNTASKLNLSLSAGSHTFNLIGIQPSVAVDRVIITSDTACVPTGTGDNCANPPDTTPPTVSVTAPANGATVSGASVPITATANDDSGTVSKVEFYINSTLVATDTTNSFGISWNSTTVANGNYTIAARAYDAANNATTSSGVTVTVNNTLPDTTKPTTSITAPTNGQTVSGNLTFSATANDNVAVTRVEFSVDGTLKSTDTSSPHSAIIDTTTLSNASHTLTATAYDAAGNSQAASVTVTVNNASGGGGGTPPAKPGDVNNDGHVGFPDIVLIASHYNQTVSAYTYGDVNGDGKVNFQDIIVVAAHYGQ